MRTTILRIERYVMGGTPMETQQVLKDGFPVATVTYRLVPGVRRLRRRTTKQLVREHLL